MKLRQNKRNQGITLVALVVTIIVLIILATISIRMVIGEGGLIYQANNAKLEYRGATVDEEVLAWKAEKKMAKYVGGIQPKDRDVLIDDQLERGLLTQEEADDAKENGEVQIGSRVIYYGEPSTVKEAKEHQYKFEDTTTLPDEKGNEVVIPGKFKIAEDSGDTVEQGIVIEDSDGNQFVWIPVSNIDGTNDSDDERAIIKDDGTEVTITLGRYEDFTMEGITPPTPEQKGSEYTVYMDHKIKISGTDYSELNESRESSGEGNSTSDLNATARDLAKFVSSVQKNHGYYIGRYEASYGSGNSFGVGNNTYYKPLVQPSIANSTSRMDYTSKTLWNYITQGDASKVCRNMYNGNDDESKYVESDLINSYAWDTAIVYIQAMKNENYANKKGTEINQSLANTGENDDHPCNIYDMAGNVREWTTEYSENTSSSIAYPCVSRGGRYNDNNDFTADRISSRVTDSVSHVGFRPGIYIK